MADGGYDVVDHRDVDPRFGTRADVDALLVDAHALGFTDPATSPWLPQPAGWSSLTVERQRSDPESMLSLYRAALALRRQLPGLATDELIWEEEAGADVLAFLRGAGFRCLVNLGPAPVPLAGRGEVLLASAALREVLPPDTAVWLGTDQPPS